MPPERCSHFGSQLQRAPPFGEYWQFQIVSMAPEGQNVKSGDQLITFDAQKVQQDLQSLRSELDSATKELEKTQVSIDLERQELSEKLATAENNFEKCKLKQGVSSDIEASSVIEKDGLDLEQARREVAALKEDSNGTPSRARPPTTLSKAAKSALKTKWMLSRKAWKAFKRRPTATESSSTR
jgi:multidrug resistance efflux pump